MKALSVVLLAVLLLSGSVPALAQHRHGMRLNAPQLKTGAARQAPANDTMNMMHGNMMGMMQSDMMHQMPMQTMGMMGQGMSHPLHHAAMTVQMLPTMKDPLGLSNEQVAHLDAIAGQFKEQQAPLQEKVTQAEDQLAVLLENDQPDLKKVKSLLQERATYTADWQALDVETAHRMQAELTQEQRAKLAGLPCPMMTLQDKTPKPQSLRPPSKR